LIDESRKDTFKREEDETRKSNMKVTDKGKGKMQEVDNSSEIEEENQGEREGRERRLNGLLWVCAMITVCEFMYFEGRIVFERCSGEYTRQFLP
jgi:hypothetical protein